MAVYVIKGFEDDVNYYQGHASCERESGSGVRSEWSDKPGEALRFGSALEASRQLMQYYKDGGLNEARIVRLRPSAPPSRYVVRADTDLGPVYLRSLEGSTTEWTSELRYARKFLSKEVAEAYQGSAYCPDATRIRVRRLRKSPGYHIRLKLCKDLCANGNPSDGSSRFGSREFRRIFRTRKAAEKWITDRKAVGGGVGLEIVPESPVPGGAAQ